MQWPVGPNCIMALSPPVYSLGAGAQLGLLQGLEGLPCNVVCLQDHGT